MVHGENDMKTNQGGIGKGKDDETDCANQNSFFYVETLNPLIGDIVISCPDSCLVYGLWGPLQLICACEYRLVWSVRLARTRVVLYFGQGDKAVMGIQRRSGSPWIRIRQQPMQLLEYNILSVL